MRRHIKRGVLPGVLIIRRPAPPATTDTLQTEAGDDLLTESGQEIKKES